MHIDVDGSEMIVIQPTNPANAVVAYNQWGVGGSDVGINIRRGNLVVCSVDLTVAEALELAQQLEQAAIGAKYMALGYQLSQSSE
jgi:hypothetical protein